MCLDMCVCVPSMLCACVMNLAACTSDAAQNLLLRHGMAECLRREIHVSVG